MKLTAQQVYDKLINDDQILSSKGRITFHLANIDIIVRQRDVVGNIMQEWVEGWLKKNGVEYAPNDNTQMPPDFYLDPDDKQHNLMEIKAFNYKASPGFDIADFRMYEQEISAKPWMLDVTYLIFGYEMSDNGDVTIKHVWTKKVWEITRAMESGEKNHKVIWPLNLQIKKEVVHKIRPAKWYGKSTKFPIFQSMEDFLAAVEETVFQDEDTHKDFAGWRQHITTNYEKVYGKKLVFPRWSEIVEKYTPTKKKNK